MKIDEVKNGFDNGVIAKNDNTLCGELRLSGRRISVNFVLRWIKSGNSLDELDELYDISKEQVNNVLSEVIELIDSLQFIGSDRSPEEIEKIKETFKIFNKE